MVEGDAWHPSDMTRSPARNRSQHIYSQRHLQAGTMTPVPVLRTEVTPRRIPRTVTPIQMEMAQRLLSRRGRRGSLDLELDSADADVPALFFFLHVVVAHCTV